MGKLSERQLFWINIISAIGIFGFGVLFVWLSPRHPAASAFLFIGLGCAPIALASGNLWQQKHDHNAAAQSKSKSVRRE